jgi:glycosyltransferase involved in cell wall biosynthesis
LIKPFVTILTPSFNSVEFIELSILSILNQDYHPLEHIVVDGNSQDGTVDILNRYSDRISWISEPDRGQSDALNKGIRLAKGEIIGWVNADDLYLPGVVSRSVEKLLTTGAAAVYSDGDLIDASGNLIGEWNGHPFSFKDLLMGENFICQPSIFIRRSVLDEIGYIDERMHFTMDYDLFLRLGMKYPIDYINSKGASFRLHPASKTVSSIRSFHSERLLTLDKIFNSTDFPKEYSKIKNEAYARAYVMVACHEYQFGNCRDGQDYLEQAYHFSPNEFSNPDTFFPFFIGCMIFGGDSLALIDALFSSLPDSISFLKKYHHKAASYAYISSAFFEHHYGNSRKAGQLALKGVMNNMAWGKNKGVLSIGLNGLIGKSKYDQLKNFLKRFQ